MRIYIASSWRNVHGVQMLTKNLRDAGHVVLSFVEKNFGEAIVTDARFKDYQTAQGMAFEDWCWSLSGELAFKFDIESATKCDLLIYLSPSGNDASAEMGAAWASGVPIFGLWSKGENLGLMRRMFTSCFSDFEGLLVAVELLSAGKWGAK